MMDFLKAIDELKPALEELRQFRREVAAARQEIHDARVEMAKLTLDIESRMTYLSPILENISARQTEIELGMMGIKGRVGLT